MWVGYVRTKTNWTENKPENTGEKRGGGAEDKADSVSHPLPWIKCFIKSTHWNWHSWIWGGKMTTPQNISFLHWSPDGQWVHLGSCLCWGEGQLWTREWGQSQPASCFRSSALALIAEMCVWGQRALRFSGGFPEPRFQRPGDTAQQGCQLRLPARPQDFLPAPQLRAPKTHLLLGEQPCLPNSPGRARLGTSNANFCFSETSSWDRSQSLWEKKD